MKNHNKQQQENLQILPIERATKKNTSTSMRPRKPSRDHLHRSLSGMNPINLDAIQKIQTFKLKLITKATIEESLP